MAERVGFEPTKGYKPLLVFKTSAFDHSATSPVLDRATAHSAGSRARIQYATTLKFADCRPYPAVSTQEIERTPASYPGRSAGSVFLKSENEFRYG